MSEKPHLSLILRGHIRSSFGDSRLFDLLSAVSNVFELRIYAHTWNVVQNSVSWRGLKEIPDPVDESMVRDYLSGLDVRWVSVSDDKSITHQGKTRGNIGRTPCPVIGWKNMYWGLLQACGVAWLSEHPHAPTVQTRFDLLSNPFSPSHEEVLNFLSREHEVLTAGAGAERMRFLRMRCFVGVDNIYMATSEDLFRFVSYMYNDMDRILFVHRGTIHQEHIAFHERMSFWNWKIPDKPVH